MTRSDVLELKDELTYETEMYQSAKETLNICLHNLSQVQIKFRMAEVEYVLQELCWNREGTIPKRELDTYLTHCINMLHGNIDGTVLNMENNDESEEV